LTLYVNKYQETKKTGELEVKFRQFLTLALDGNVIFTVRPLYFRKELPLPIGQEAL
jgi:hypothetical protein